ncbi:sugar transferase [Brevibacillus dissolubilis]|uniref:sugar transferase n=1 Tax=Brevibacillus dissolubilis TaxID=1844116 RepID=UPI00159BD307|nr:sugar transferase [Brevibacillus dissolubilis]
MKSKTVQIDPKLYAVSEPNQQVQKKKANLSRLSFWFGLAEWGLISAFFYFVYVWRISTEFEIASPWLRLDLPRFGEYALFYTVFMLINFFLILHYRLYSVQQATSFFDEYTKSVKAALYAVLISVGISFFLKIIVYSRLVILIVVLGNLLISFTVRLIRRLVISQLYQRGHLLRRALLVGEGTLTENLLKEIQSGKQMGISVVGVVMDSDEDSLSGLPVLPKTSDLRQTIINEEIDEIIITSLDDRPYIEYLFQKLRKYDVDFKVIPDMFNIISSPIELGHITTMPYFSLVRTPMKGINLVWKRFFDIILSVIIVLLLSPLFLVTAIAIKLDSKGELIYRQQRVGKNGQLFHMYKFRSMVQEAEKLLASLEDANEADGPVFKIKNDPRLTKVGKFIRKYSIDELPQLFNVIKGDMSLVGPRPPLPVEVEQYGDREWRRMEVVPGITGMWQVSGRSNLRFQQWVDLDLYYIENWSILLDLKIMLRTIPAVLKGEGAY